MSSPTPRLVAGRYALLHPLGSGGMGTVWRARDEVLGREVAVKEVTFPSGLSEAEREVLRERTRREARAAARLDHPSAVTVYDVVEQDGSPFLVMELVEARTLADVVREDGPLEPARAAAVGLALLGALEAAHAQGVLHRDVKPANVLVRDDGRVVLTDFGIATGLGDSSLTSTGLLVGSPSYIAPERARGEPAGPPSDLWSLGATLFTAVEGRPPYDRGEPLLTVSAVVSGEPAPYALAGPLAPVLDGLLDKDPARRSGVATARAQLERVAEQRASGTQVLPVAGPVPEVRQSSRTAALRLDEVPAVPPPAGRHPEPRRQPPPPARPGPRPTVRPAAPSGRRRAWVPAAVAAVLLVLGAGALAQTLQDDGGGTPTAQGSPAPTDPAATEPPPTGAASEEPSEAPAVADEPSPVEQAPSPTVAPEPSEPSEPEAGPEGLPAGWTTDTAPAGWTVALPPGYAQTRAGEYRNGEGRTLRIETGQGQPDAVGDRRRAAEGFARRHPTYEQIRLEGVDYKGYPAADWEFTYEGLHVINRVFVVGETGHSLFLQFPEGDDGAAADFEAIAERFSPVGA